MKQSLFWSTIFKIHFIIPDSTSTYKNVKKCVSKIIKHTRSGKLDEEEATHIEGCVNPNINERYNLTPKNSPVHYADMLLTLTKNMLVKISSFLSLIVTVGTYEGINFRITIR